TLAPAKDTTIYAEGELGNGAGTSLFAGATADLNNGAPRRALLAFDVAGSIPAGAVVTSATLTLTVTMSVSGPQPVTLHRLLADWGEGTSDAPNAEG
ncbi:MAG TPA: DNRLRE domain-containing protein, partial [Candidatus Dormibacteraeota bacterium]|nr:DNRLRE domain-containing protein [Candidatus Dormibacteraeota bacterium]